MKNRNWTVTLPNILLKYEDKRKNLVENTSTYGSFFDMHRLSNITFKIIFEVLINSKWKIHKVSISTKKYIHKNCPKSVSPSSYHLKSKMRQVVKWWLMFYPWLNLRRMFDKQCWQRLGNNNINSLSSLLMCSRKNCIILLTKRVNYKQIWSQLCYTKKLKNKLKNRANMCLKNN